MIDYISHYGGDLTVVNAARVSLGRVKTELNADDAKLIRYLVRNRHTSPLRHCALTVRVTAPIFIARQWVKHRVGMEINEISGRYVQFDEAQAWEPAMWRQGSTAIKQGSLAAGIERQEDANWAYGAAIKNAFDSYELLLSMGVCKEQARAVLPLATLTQFICTGSLQAWWHFYGLRADRHAQAEIRPYAEAIGALMSQHFPVTWETLRSQP